MPLRVKVGRREPASALAAVRAPPGSTGAPNLGVRSRIAVSSHVRLRSERVPQVRFGVSDDGLGGFRRAEVGVSEGRGSCRVQGAEVSVAVGSLIDAAAGELAAECRECLLRQLGSLSTRNCTVL